MEEIRLVQYDEVPFRGSTIPAALIERGGRQVIVVHAKSTCDRLGIAWQPQHRAITSHPVWSRGIITMMTPLSSGNETLMLELRYWLLRTSRKQRSKGCERGCRQAHRIL